MSRQNPIICLDAGHYAYYNQSPANRNYWESKAMWTLHLLLKGYLERYGIKVITTRSNQAEDLELTARGRKAAGCDLFLSLHSNAVGSYVDENVDYVVVYRLTDDNTTNVDEISNELAYILAPLIASTMGTKQAWAVKQRLSDNDRNYDGMFNDNYYGVLHGARTVGVPGLILEHSFHTNTRITNWLLDENNLDKLAKAEAEAIAKYFGMTGKVDAPTANPAPAPSEAPAEKYYRVRKSWDDAKSQIGAYKILDNAKKPESCPEGYTVYDWNGNAVYPFNNVEPPKAETKISVLEWQKAAIADGFEFPLYGADGLWGEECEGVAKIAIVKNRGKDDYRYRNLTKLVQRVVGVVQDGLAGEDTASGIGEYQRTHGLDDDECVGINTWKKMLGV